MNLKALVVDDDHLVQFLNKKLLNSLGIEVDIANNGFEALVRLKHHTYDFLLMDINMPEQDGLDTARWIRDDRNKPYRDIPIFALTSYGSLQHTLEIKDAGINEHLQKPLDAKLLIAILKRYFRNKVGSDVLSLL
jgi:two-component system sensor histidine kinase/response regulator